MGGWWLFRCGVAQNSTKRERTLSLCPQRFSIEYQTTSECRAWITIVSLQETLLLKKKKKTSHFNQRQLLYTPFYKQGNKCLDSGFHSQEILILDKFSLISVHWVLPSIWPGGSSELFSVLLSEPCGPLRCLYGKFCLLGLSFEPVRHLPDDREG